MIYNYRDKIYQFKIRYQEDHRPWEDIPVFEESDWSGAQGAATHASIDILADDPNQTIREIRYNVKGNLQGGYVPGANRLTVWAQKNV